MQFSKRTQYGLRAMICLAAAYKGGFLQARELAKREGLPIKFLETILSTLGREKFLASKIGANGGYRLTRAPEHILVADIVARLEGGNMMDEEEPGDGTERPGEVAVRLVEDKLAAVVREVLTSTTLAQLMEDVLVKKSRTGEMYYI